MREDALRTATILVEGKVGPSTDNAWYSAITEGRRDFVDPSGAEHRYGWCGDFATYCCMQGGVLDGSILNRASLNNGKWTPGDNLARLERWARSVGAARSVMEVAANRDQVTGGDLVIFSRPDGDHIGMFERWTAAGEFSSLDGNSVGRVCARNFRRLTKEGFLAPRVFILTSQMPWAVGPGLDPGCVPPWLDATGPAVAPIDLDDIIDTAIAALGGNSSTLLSRN